MSLAQYFWLNTKIPIHKWTYYLPIYERHFAPFRDRSIFFLEIGSGQGGSSQMWKHYFGPLAQIVTIDIREECRAFADEQVAVRIGDQGNAAFLDEVLGEFGSPDIVLDDGSHQQSHVASSFSHLYPKMARDGVYLIEDLHTAYWPEYGGGLYGAESFIEKSKANIDQLNAGHVRQEFEVKELAKVTRSIHFYDSVVVYEKGPVIAKVDRSVPWVDETVKW